MKRDFHLRSHFEVNFHLCARVHVCVCERILIIENTLNMSRVEQEKCRFGEGEKKDKEDARSEKQRKNVTLPISIQFGSTKWIGKS